LFHKNRGTGKPRIKLEDWGQLKQEYEKNPDGCTDGGEYSH
jgi:hypothetical protein